MKIPYGKCDFISIRERGQFYSDKTIFLPLMEDDDRYGQYHVFLRPRRFGKSTLVHMLSCYYDVNLKHRFDDLFKGLYIHQHPTKNQGKYLILSFDFSTVATDGDKAKMEASFDQLVLLRCQSFARKYAALHPALDALQPWLKQERPAATTVTGVLEAVDATPFKVFLLIDEYDNFAHALLTNEAAQLRAELQQELGDRREKGTLYSEAFRGAGFVKSFYKAMKVHTGTCLDRAFITGVTPIVLDDMASGFNVVTHLTLKPKFHALAGLTHADVALAAAQFAEEFPEFGTQEVILQELLYNYDHYRFSLGAKETLFNPTMVFYFLQQLADWGRPPEEMLDSNCRTDYEKLRLIAQPPELTDEAYMESLIDIVKTEKAHGKLLDSFSAYHLHSALTLPSLLFYMGLLTLEDKDHQGIRFTIPNRVIKEMHWQDLYEMLLRRNGITVHLPKLIACVGELAWKGDLQPLVDLIQKHVLDILSSQDLKYMSEEVVKVLFAGYIVLGNVYNVLSEQELVPGGYADLFLGLDRRHPQAQWGWILEFKYISKKSATQAQIQAKQKEAREQLERYLEDGPRLRQLLGRPRYKAASIVCVGLKKCVVELVKRVEP